MAVFSSLVPLLALYAYSVVSRLIERRRMSLSQLMNEQRRNWVTQALRRETPLDAILAGNLMSSVSFFASTTALLILALFTIIGRLPEFMPALNAVNFGAEYTATDLQIHNVAMLVLFVSAFLAFTLALRQFNHFCILIGGCNRAIEPEPEEVRAIARINALAAQNFNTGIRAYYFAIPMVAWFVSDWMCILVTVATVGFLVHREFFSEARWVVARITPH